MYASTHPLAVMVKRPDLLGAFERDRMRAARPDFWSNLCLYEALYRQACALGVLPPENPLEGIEHDVQLARALNAHV